MKIVLIGYMGSGKTTIGQQLAKILTYPFLDLDHLIELNEENKISEIFSEKGEIYFRKKEKTTLKRIINNSEKLILSTGGGTPCYSNVMNDLTHDDEVITIYLKASIEELTNRLFTEKNKRPLIAHLKNKEHLNDFIRKHLFERSYFYIQSSIIVSVDNKTISEIVKEIVLQLF